MFQLLYKPKSIESWLKVKWLECPTSLLHHPFVVCKHGDGSGVSICFALDSPGGAKMPRKTLRASDLQVTLLINIPTWNFTDWELKISLLTAFETMCRNPFMFNRSTVRPVPTQLVESWKPAAFAVLMRRSLLRVAAVDLNSA